MHVYQEGKWGAHAPPPPVEATVRIFVDGERIAAFMCTPEKLRYLAVGFLYTSGIIGSLEDIGSIDINKSEGTMSVTLKKKSDCLPRPDQAIFTAGFGGGVIFSDSAIKSAAPPGIFLNPEKLISLVEEMKANAALYKISGGIHASAVSDGEIIFSLAEDVGRHNTLDKVVGECLIKEMPLRGCAILTTGRMSSEMVLKSVRLGITAIASLSSPTTRAVSLAREHGIAMAGYVAKKGFIAYSGAERLGLPPQK